MCQKPKRPLTQREIKQQKQKKVKEEVKFVTIVNRSKRQTIPIQLKAPAGHDFFVGEQTIPIYPQRMAKLPENRLYSEQIANLQKQGRIQVFNAN